MMGEYDAGYENCIDAMVRQMEDMQFRIDNLHRENAKLRDELDLCLKCEECEAMLDCDECLRADASQKERKRLDYENAKLRELVRDMWGFIEGTDEDCGDVTFSSCFDYCKHDTADDGCSKTGECWYEQRMSELGVEV